MSGGDVCAGMWTSGSASLREHVPKETRIENVNNPFFANKAECARRVYQEKTCHLWQMLPMQQTPTYSNRDLEDKILAKAMDEPGHRFLTIDYSGVCDAAMSPDAIVCRDGKCFQRQPRAYEGVQVQCSNTRHNGFGCTCDAITLVDGVFAAKNGPSTFETCRFEGWNNHSGWDEKYKAPVKIVTPPPAPHDWNRPSPDMAAEAVIDVASNLTSSGKPLGLYKISVKRDPKTGEYQGVSQLNMYGRGCLTDANCGGTAPFCVYKRECSSGFLHSCDNRGYCKECTHNNGTQCKDPFDAKKTYVCTVPGEDGTGMGKCTKDEFTGNLGQKCRVDADCGKSDDDTGGNARMCREGVCKRCDKNNGRECGKFVCDTAKFVCKTDEVFVGNVGDKCASTNDCGGIAKYCQNGICKQCDKNNNTQCDGHVCDVAKGKCTNTVFVGNIGDSCTVGNNGDCAGTAKFCVGAGAQGKCVQCFVDNGTQCGDKVCDVSNGKCTDKQFTGNYGKVCNDDGECGGTSPHCQYIASRMTKMCTECSGSDTSLCGGPNGCRVSVGKCVDPPKPKPKEQGKPADTTHRTLKPCPDSNGPARDDCWRQKQELCSCNPECCNIACGYNYGLKVGPMICEGSSCNCKACGCKDIGQQEKDKANAEAAADKRAAEQEKDKANAEAAADKRAAEQMAAADKRAAEQAI